MDYFKEMVNQRGDTTMQESVTEKVNDFQESKLVTITPRDHGLANNLKYDQLLNQMKSIVDKNTFSKISNLPQF